MYNLIIKEVRSYRIALFSTKKKKKIGLRLMWLFLLFYFILIELCKILYNKNKHFWKR